jgi:hypothetical protein
MVKKDYVKKTEKGDDVTRFWYTLKNLDPMVKCSPCKWVSQICMKYKFWSLDRFLEEHMLQHGRAQVVSPSSFWMFPKFEDQFIPHSQLARRMGLL